MSLNVFDRKKLIVIYFCVVLAGCAQTEPLQESVNVCDSSGCREQPKNYASFNPLKEVGNSELDVKIASLEMLAKSDPHAAYDLALRLFRADGVPQNLYSSIKWMRFAAEKGEFEAQKALGRLYLTGIAEMGADPGEAEKWLSITVSRGDKEAAELLKQAAIARQSEQRMYQFYNRWRPLFYNNWYQGYPYRLHWNNHGWVR